ncbi:sigma-54-dependent transcriptional regulator [Desulfosediminicola sp.]|uniref:sigma-54-dependent transcriptional regulator n=1 Tax=Desulfosediminicola sp. TaxID=2886825 RepID=UPI003AF1ED84
MSSTKYTLLLVDDDTNILEVLDARFSAAGFRTHKATNGQTALALLTSEQIDLVISDVKMPSMSGIELYAEMQQKSPGLPVIFLTAFGNIPEAVTAVQSGALDYLTKPFDGKTLVQKVKDFFAAGKTVPSHTGTNDVEEGSAGFIWGSSKPMVAIKEMVSRVASSDVNTLILGESGVGKECIAKAIHDASPRRNGPLIVVDCGSTPPGILESELFGHTKGAFTNAIQDKTGLIEAAEGGTLFLDEIGNISSEMQHRLLRFLEDRKIRRVGAIDEKQIDCRVLAATNADLTADIEEGKFRQDLYYRLRVVTLNLPPLRERRQDIPRLAKMFVQRHCNTYNIPVVHIPDSTMDWLEQLDWPGNVRELKNALEAGVVLCRNNTLLPEDFQLEQPTSKSRKEDSAPDQGSEFSLENSEREAIIRALRQTNGVQKSAAELLDISRRSIHYKLKKYDIQPSDYK